jgi:hypothetical protein
MFRGVIVTIQLSINSGRKTDTLPRKRFVVGRRYANQIWNELVAPVAASLVV